MPGFATYQPLEASLQPPDDLVLGVAEQRHADSIAALYSVREGLPVEVGAAWLDHEEAPKGFYLLGVVVDESFRRQGIGHVLTQMRLDWIRGRADQAYYFANAANEPTIDLHERFGFREVSAET